MCRRQSPVDLDESGRDSLPPPPQKVGSLAINRGVGENVILQVDLLALQVQFCLFYHNVRFWQLIRKKGGRRDRNTRECSGQPASPMFCS